MRRMQRAIITVAFVAALAGAVGVSAAGADGAQEHGHDRVHEFDDAARWAERFNDPERDAWQRPREVIRLLGLGEGMTVADIGAGTGYFLPYLSEAVGPSGFVLGLDVSEEMVAWMREEVVPGLPLDNVSARVVAPDDPDLAPGSVDRVLIVNTWHHIPARDEYAKRLAAALKSGGSIAVVDFTSDSEAGPPHEMRLTPDQVIAELEAGGFETELLEEDLPRQYVVLGRK